MGQAASCLAPDKSHPHSQSQKSIKQEEVVKKVNNTLTTCFRAIEASRPLFKSWKGSAALHTA